MQVVETRAGLAALALLAALAAGCGPEPEPGRAGAPCAEDAECGPGEVCLTQLPGGLCGGTCDEGCPAGTTCVALGVEDLCVTRCDGPGACRAGYECVDGACAPVSECGDVPAEGRCEGATLTWCEGWRVATLDCGRFTDDHGLALTCGTAEGGAPDCVPQAVTGCGTVTPQGRCEENTLVYCESRETGVIRREPCPADEECRVGEDGLAGCAPPGASGCGEVTGLGRCEGAVAVWCADGALRRFDCASQGDRCDWVDDTVGYWCVAPPEGALRVTGTFLFERRPVGPEGLGDPEAAPMRHVTVQVRRTDGSLVASDRTDAAGRFEVPFEGTGEFLVSPLSRAGGERYAISVEDCPEDTCGDGAFLYGGASPTFRPQEADAEGRIDLGTLTLADPAAAGAFNVLDVLVTGFDFAWETFGRSPPPLTAQWRSGAGTWCGTSCYDPRRHTIFVLSRPEDRDEWDAPVLAHEFGHFLEEAFSRSDSPGGYHDGYPTDPRLAWSEGYGTWVGATLHGSPLYVDTFASGVLAVDLSDTGYPRPDPAAPMDQRISEFVVGELLWHLAHGGPETPALGTAPVFDVMGAWFLDPAFADRGVDGVDLVDLLDGWFCRGHGRRDVVEAVVNDRMGFPYDYGGPIQCP